LEPALLLDRVASVSYLPAPGALILGEPPMSEEQAEEFRALRTRLNHLQKRHTIHTAVITSPDAGDGKSFVALNLAIAQAQLNGASTLLCDFDLRHPAIHHALSLERGPGITDYLEGRVPLQEAIRRIEGTNLFVLPAGSEAINPLELLNLRETAGLLHELRRHFHWILLDTPPLLAASDANLLATLCDGTILVARIGSTSLDSVRRAVDSLCENNVIGVVVNGLEEGLGTGLSARLAVPAEIDSAD
jgi:receptor protein-tyrosine kinase